MTSGFLTLCRSRSREWGLLSHPLRGKGQGFLVIYRGCFFRSSSCRLGLSDSLTFPISDSVLEFHIRISLLSLSVPVPFKDPVSDISDSYNTMDGIRFFPPCFTQKSNGFGVGFCISYPFLS